MKTEFGDKIKGFLLKKLGKNLRRLLPNELTVGNFGDLRKIYTIGKNGLTAHHIPSDAYMEKLIEKGILNRSLYKKGGDDGLCIVVESIAGMTDRTARHNRTKTFLSNLGSGRPAYYNLSPKQGLEFDIDDLRNIYKTDGVYNLDVEAALQDLIKQTKVKYKPIFD